jgi:hypothetical protein
MMYIFISHREGSYQQDAGCAVPFRNTLRRWRVERAKSNGNRASGTGDQHGSSRFHRFYGQPRGAGEISPVKSAFFWTGRSQAGGMRLSSMAANFRNAVSRKICFTAERLIRSRRTSSSTVILALACQRRPWTTSSVSVIRSHFRFCTAKSTRDHKLFSFCSPAVIDFFSGEEGHHEQS